MRVRTAFISISAAILALACGQRAENVPVKAGAGTATATQTEPAAGTDSAAPPAGVPTSVAMPDSAFKASWSGLNPPKTVKAGEKLKFKPTVRNTGDHPWPGKEVAPYNMVAAGVRWVRSNTAPADYKVRTQLETSLQPG